jgi:nitronate monooxygenase
MSPAGLPGRAILSNQKAIVEYDKERASFCTLGCLKKCSYKESRERFCIIKSLDRAQRGDVETGLIFCGTNAWKSDHIGTVQEIFDELFCAEAVDAEAAEENQAA